MTQLLEQRSCSAPDARDVMAYDLRIGVTGHRNLSAEKVPAIEAAVRGVLERMEQVLVESSARPQAYPATKPYTLRQWSGWLGERIDLGLVAALRWIWRAVPDNPQIVPAERQTPFRWVVVSPLAKGADRIVAREVLALTYPHPNPLPKRDGDDEGPRLEVVLPMPLAQYREDFKDSLDRDEFEELFAKAAWTNEADRLMPTDVAPGAPRNTAYQLAGHTVVNRCDVLIAIWDGKPADGAGGTGDIVPYAIQQGRPVLWINSERPETPVTLLTKNGSALARPWPALNDDDPMHGVAIDEFPIRAKQISLGFHRLAAFQRDAALDRSQFGAKLASKQKELQADLCPHGLLPAAQIIGETITPPMVRADMLAQRYQWLHRCSVVLIYSLALVAVTVAVAQQVFWPAHHWIVALEIIALLAAWGLLRVNCRERWQEKYLNDRYLAEWLRRAQFEVLVPPGPQSDSATVTESSNFCAALPTVGQVELHHGPETWFVNAFQKAIDRAGRAIHCERGVGASAVPISTLREALLKAWIRPQADWHQHKAKLQHDRARFGQDLTRALFVATLLFATIHMLFGHALHGAIGRWITLLAIVLPAAAATLHSIERFFHYERTADRSEQMARQLRQLADRMQAAETDDEVRQVVRAVDALMAREVDEWWVAGNLHRPGHPV